ncbi:Hexuronate transporter [Edwardsiella anguillarum]|uniref:MFS transporter n=1 Tax=Edwardsiella TaxID=635 RepID=UPI00045CB9F9|nr:hexuronate transporter [Edwardsiella sp. EA181011]BET80615.1 Hexuronate transporter [Edwardsiella anguillarum]GAJ68290.1 sugar phosphate permease [Edwardsiella piscicida]BET83904.1 Hexuronate transporter [Edwardsiella anguillarum]BET87271.1 Hexuronate transporter [Edwardsiella anguillarum]
MKKKHILGLRWWIIGLVTLAVILNYLDRSALAVAMPTIKDDIGLTTQEYSYIVAAFQGAYMIMQPIAGYILDILGSRIGYAVFAILWSLSCMIHAFATGWISLAFFRTLLGLSESAVIPASMKVVSEWFPDKEKSVATGWFNSGTSIGAMIAPPLVIWCILTYSWQEAFVIVGGLGFIWVIIWLMFYRDVQKHTRLSPDEKHYIISGQTLAVDEKNGIKTSWRNMLRKKNLWVLMSTRFLIAPAWATFTFWIPIYLATVRGMSLKEIALFAWMPFLAADLGSIIGGYLCPFFVNRFKTSIITSRKLVVLIGSLLMFAPACIGLVTDKYMAVALFCIGGFAHQAISGALITLSSDIFPKNEVATASGWTGSAAWLSQACFSLVIGAAVTTIGYDTLFVSLAFFDVLAAIILWKYISSPFKQQEI